MPADKNEVVFLEHIASSGLRRWRRAHLLLDPIAGLITLRFREGLVPMLRTKKTLEWHVGQLESFDVEMQPSPHSSIYERAFVVLLLLLATNLTIRFNLDDTFFEPLGELVPLLLAAGLAAGISHLIKVPVIRFRVPDAVQQREKQHPVYGPVQQALRERMQRELDKQGKAVTEAELDAMITGSGESLPEPMEKINSRLFRASAIFDPGTFRLHGARWGSVKKTQTLVQRFEQTLIEHRVADVMPGQWRDLPWQRSRIITSLSRLTALLIILGGLGYLLWMPLDRLLFDHPSDFSKVQPGDLEANFQTMSGKGTVKVAAVSPDRALIAVGGGWGVYVYDAATYEEIWRGSTYHPVYSLAWSPDGTRLAAGEGNGVITLWNAETWEWQVALYAHQGFVRALDFSPDGLSLASGAEDGLVIIWDVDTAAPATQLEHPAASLDWSPDGSTLALGTYGGRIELWDISHAQVEWEAEAGQGWIDRVAFSSDGQQVTTVNTLGGITLWDASTGERLRTFAQDLEVGDAAWSPDGSQLLAGVRGGDIVGIDGNTGDTLSTWKWGYTINDVDWLSDDRALLVVPIDGQVLVLHTGEAAPIHLFDGYSGQVWDVAWTGNTLAWTYSNEKGYLWDDPDKGTPHMFTGGRLLAFSPDGTDLALVINNAVVIRDMETQDITAALLVDTSILAHAAWLDNQHIAIRHGDEKVEIRDTTTEETLRTLLIPEQETTSYGIRSLAASPDGSHIAVGLLGSAITFDAETGAIIHTYDGLPGDVSDLAYSPDGSMLSAVAGRVCIVWDSATHQELYRFTVDDMGLTRVVWSSDGVLVAAGSLTGKVTIWGVGGKSAGQQVLTIEPFDQLQPIGGLAWSPDGETLAVGSWDGTLTLWEITQ